MNINEVIQNGREVLINNGINPKEARLLLSFILGIRMEELIKYNEISAMDYDKFMEIINKRSNGEPFAYIVGHKEFMKLDFIVNSSVLIPREDTEILVQKIINMVEDSNLKNSKELSILDMCTGSGCIAISLAKYIKNSNVTAVDISKEAIVVAKKNAVKNNVNIKFIESNLFDKISETQKFDIIVSNPPYIKSSLINSLQKEVQKEPVIALDGGETGLTFYEIITKEAINHLKSGGILAFEIGFDEAESAKNIMKANNYKNIEVIKDISENDRVIIGTI